MALLNYYKDNKDGIATLIYMSRNWNDFDYYYIKAYFDKNIVVPENILKSNCKIAINFEWEPFNYVVDQIYIDVINKHNIDPKRILLLSENADLLDHISLIAKKHNKELINYEWTNIAEHTIKLQTFNNLTTFIDLQKNKFDIKKIFLSFNRRWRLHRPFFIALCIANKILDQGYVSIGVSDDEQTWDKILPTILEISKNDDVFYTLLSNNYDSIINTPYLYLDTDDLITPRHQLNYDDIKYENTFSLYKQSLISIVSETLFFENQGRFFSEKTFKPISYMHPFIFVGPANSLSLLKTLGYKTFHPFINEEYDSILDPINRLKLIMEELKKLCNKSPEEIISFKKNTYDICKFNHSHLLTRTVYNHKII